IFIIANSEANKKDALEALLSPYDNTYQINFFYDVFDENYSNHLTSYWNSDDKLQDLLVIQLYNVTVDFNKNLVKFLDMHEYPHYVVTDNESIVLSTSNFQDIEEYFRLTIKQ